MNAFLSVRFSTYFVIAASLGIARQAAVADQPSRTGPASLGAQATSNDWLGQMLASLASERERVEASLAKERADSPRADLLAAYGRSAAASGQFRESAAAYAMFLSEFGTDHVYSEAILARLASSLAPLDLDSIEVLHTVAGPQYRPTWRMGKAASDEQLRRAVGAYELLASITKDQDQVVKALYALGWVHRALNDWSSSTAAWDRAAEIAKSSTVGADALWNAADNLAWTGHSAEAANRLRRLTTEHPGDSRIQTASDRIETLEAEARRTPAWVADPVASLQHEIAERAARRKPHEVYQSAVQWLQARQNSAAVIAVSRWAAAQDNWPVGSRLQAHYDLANALLSRSESGATAKTEAADVFGEIILLSPTDDWAIQAAIRRSRILSELGRFDAADKTLTSNEARWNNNSQWEPAVLIERIQSLVDRGDLTAARSALEDLRHRYRDYEPPTELARTLATDNNGGGR